MNKGPSKRPTSPEIPTPSLYLGVAIVVSVPHTEIRRSLKVSEYPLRGHHMFILRIAHRPSLLHTE